MRYVMAAIAFVTCPCHLPIALALLGGTTLGTALAEHVGLTLAVLGAAFVGSLWIAVRLFAREKGQPIVPAEMAESVTQPQTSKDRERQARSEDEVAPT